MSVLSRLVEAVNPQRSSPLSMADYLEYFRFGGNAYMSTGFSQTMPGREQDIPTSFAGYVEQIKKGNAVVFACMDVRRRLFSEARLQFRRFDDGRPGEMYGGRDGRNPAYRDLVLLGAPWPGGTTRDLLSMAIDHADAAGNAFVVRRAGRLRLPRPDWMTIVSGSYDDPDMAADDLDAEVLGYIYHPGGRHSGRQAITLLPEQVAHWKLIPDPLAPYRGMSWITPVLREIAGDSAMTDHKLRYFEHAATPNLAITLDPSVSLTDAREWIALFQQDHEGSLNAYRTLFLGGGSTPVPIGSDLAQIDFKSVQGGGETRIAADAGVPPIIVGLSEGLAAATYSNYGQARRAFADLTMRPLWGSFTASLANIVGVPQGSELWYDDRDISFLQEDVKDAAEIQASEASTIQKLINSGYTAESIVDAVRSNDWTKLEHTGLFSVQLQPPTTEAPPIELEATKPALPLLTAGRSMDGAVRCDGERLLHGELRSCNAKLAEAPPFVGQCWRCGKAHDISIADHRARATAVGPPAPDPAATLSDLFEALPERIARALPPAIEVHLPDPPRLSKRIVRDGSDFIVTEE